MARLAALLLVGVIATTCFAQTVAGAAQVGASYDAAVAAVSSARAVPLGRAASPDDAPWRAALDAATRAVEVAAAAVSGNDTPPARTDLLHALRLEAHVYGLVNWYSRAFAAWDEFLAQGGELSDSGPAMPRGTEPLPTDRDEFTRVIGQLAFARYEAGDLDEARSWYLTLLDVAPDHPEALRWLARIAYEEGDAAAAVRLWQRLVEVAPEDEGARFFLELSRERERYGVEASDSYRTGLRAYEAGKLEAALEGFEAALAAQPEFEAAAVWAGRTALELEQPDTAADYWKRAVELDADDARAAWFLEYSLTQVKWGVEGGRAYYAGLAAYEDGDLEEARRQFLEAAEAAPQFKEAFVWAARTTQELGRPDEAIAYWQTVLRLDRDDTRARYFIANARRAIVYGPEASGAYARGLSAYQAGDGVTAQAEFLAAAQAAPDFLQAWGYLGRVAFQNHDYDTAANAYERAAELDPNDDDYAFFAAEARRLASLGNGTSP